MKYKFYSTKNLRAIIDSNKLSDHREVGFIRSVLLERFKRANEVNTLSILSDGEGDDCEDADASFSHGGCDVCSNGLGNNVYPTHGYSSKHNEIFELGGVCHECICIEYNGID